MPLEFTYMVKYNFSKRDANFITQVGKESSLAGQVKNSDFGEILP